MPSSLGGGIDEVRRRSTGHPRNFATELEMNLPKYTVATYGFEVAARTQGGFIVKHEYLKVRDLSGAVLASYRLQEG
jgi:hypothetical protein